MKRVAVVTGASGYLGSKLVDGFTEAGWTTVRLVRHPDTSEAGGVAWTLGSPLPVACSGADCLVHAAYDLRLRRPTDIWSTNVNGSKVLLESARQEGVKQILTLSSMSAYEGTEQLYGRAKLDIEKITIGVGGTVIRPGLVVGTGAGGMAGTLRRIAALPVVPSFGKVARVYPVSEQELVRGIVLVAEQRLTTIEPVSLASVTSVSLDELLRRLRDPAKRRPVTVRLPWRAVYAGLRAVERIGLDPGFRADSMLGLVRPAPHRASTGAESWPEPVRAALEGIASGVPTDS